MYSATIIGIPEDYLGGARGAMAIRASATVARTDLRAIDLRADLRAAALVECDVPVTRRIWTARPHSSHACTG
jgi:hypothetical protein